MLILLEMLIFLLLSLGFLFLVCVGFLLNLVYVLCRRRVFIFFL